MTDLLTPQEIEQRARARGLNLQTLSDRSGVARSVLHRWKVGLQKPTLKSYQAMIAAIDSYVPPDEPKPDELAIVESATTRPARRGRSSGA